MSNISEVIGWKHNHQPGMRCKAVDGVVKIIAFPGGIPSTTLQDQWTTEYDAYIAFGGDKDDEAQRKLTDDPVLNAIVDGFHDQENRIRALESKPPVARSVVFDWLKAKYRAHL